MSGSTVPICVLFGLSGIGKSSLAAAWTDDRADAYAEIYWIDASSTASLPNSFGVIVGWLADWGLRGAGDDPREQVFAARAVSARPWLMVFDNVVDPREAAVDTSPWFGARSRDHRSARCAVRDRDYRDRSREHDKR
ncbi:hypothetical protein AB0B25_24210 [Nocardia sp. NPDC049190]|uniref:hypothetical protein n=1 Tax=Nocardia sp. NPDC049190 TaxID=3155650 RepID=UPI00340E2439